MSIIIRLILYYTPKQKSPKIFIYKYFLQFLKNVDIYTKNMFYFYLTGNKYSITIKRLLNHLTERKELCYMDNTKCILPHNHDNRTAQFLETMPTQNVFDNVADVFGIISDSSRVKILWLLCHTEECVINIAAAVSMSSPAVSHHLKVLKQAGLLSYRKVGKEVYYTLADTDDAKRIHKIVDSIFNIKCTI